MGLSVSAFTPCRSGAILHHPFSFFVACPVLIPVLLRPNTSSLVDDDHFAVVPCLAHAKTPAPTRSLHPSLKIYTKIPFVIPDRSPPASGQERKLPSKKAFSPYFYGSRDSIYHRLITYWPRLADGQSPSSAAASLPFASSLFAHCLRPPSVYLTMFTGMNAHPPPSNNRNPPRWTLHHYCRSLPHQLRPVTTRRPDPRSAARADLMLLCSFDDDTTFHDFRQPATFFDGISPPDGLLASVFFSGSDWMHLQL